MKEIPYHLYIHFDKLSSFFKGGTSREENFLRIGLTSIELSTYLLGSTIKQTKRPHTDKVLHILRGIETQLKLLNSCDFPFEAKGYKDSYSENMDNLKLLCQNYADVIDRISTLYFALSKKVRIGLDNQINEIRNHFSLLKITVKVVDTCDHKEFPDIIVTLQLNKLEYFNSEDELFMITHQISECWFNIGINELKSICKRLQKSKINFSEIERHFKVIFEMLIYLADHILLLEHMILSNYHPLRVALRGASGGQSQQSHELFSLSRKLFEQFLILLKNENKSIVQILENPNENAALLSVINHFAKLERSLKNFFFQHYVLSSSVIGSQSFGSIGHDLISLTDKFIEPIFKEIDQAKYDLTLKTNFKYGESSGSLILKKENFNSKNKQTRIVNEAIVNKVVTNYFEAISNLDLDNWVKLFAESGYMEDPLGSRPYVGHQQLSIFFKGILRFFSQIRMTIESMQIEKYATNVFWKASATSYHGKKIMFNGKEVFQINDHGKILIAQVYWDPSIIADQL